MNTVNFQCQANTNGLRGWVERWTKREKSCTGGWGIFWTKIDQKIFDGGGCSFKGPLTTSQY